MGPNLREAIPRQYGPFLPINGAASLTRRSERISKWEIFGSPNRIRTQDLLVNSRVFETLCLRVFSAFCDLRALTALGTGGARCQPKGPESSKSELFASPNRIRTSDLLVNSQVFETLCLTYRRMIQREELPSLRLGFGKVAFPHRAVTETGCPAGGLLWRRLPAVRQAAAR